MLVVRILVLKQSERAYISTMSCSNLLESSTFLELVRAKKDKLVVCFKYPQGSSEVPSIKDIVGVFEDGSTTPLAAVNVSSHYGHWLYESFKVGQVTIDIINVEFTDNQIYQLAYVRDSTGDILPSSIVYLSLKDGVLAPYVKSNNGDFTFISGAPSIDLGSFECPKSNGEPSSSFFVVTDSESLPQVTEYVQIPPKPTETLEQWIESHEDPAEPSEKWIESREEPTQPSEKLIESREEPTEPSEKWIESREEPTEPLEQWLIEDSPAEIECVESEETVNSVHKLTTEYPVKKQAIDIERIKAPRNQMSVSVNISDRVISQREAQSLKSVNKDLIQKQKKLSEIIRELQQNLEEAVKNGKNSGEVEVLKKKIESLQKDLQELKNDLKQVKDERDALLQEKLAMVKDKQEDQNTIRALQKKLAQVTVEKDTQFARSSTLLTALQDQEKENEVLKSENKVLQRKVRAAENEKRQRKVVEKEKPKEPARPVEGANKPVPHFSDQGPRDVTPAGRPLLKPQVIPHQEKSGPGVKSPRLGGEVQRPIARAAGDQQSRARPGSGERRGNESGVSTNCPICDQLLPAIMSERNKQLHVERCILTSEQPDLN